MGTLIDILKVEVDKFNNRDYTHLKLHDEVIMNEVDAPYTPHHGKGDVIKYLVDTQTIRQPILDLESATLAESPSDLTGKTHGQVTGGGTYQDNSLEYKDSSGNIVPVSDKKPVRFVFNFRKQGSDWLIINATATFVAPKSSKTQY